MMDALVADMEANKQQYCDVSEEREYDIALQTAKSMCICLRMYQAAPETDSIALMLDDFSHMRDFMIEQAEILIKFRELSKNLGEALPALELLYLIDEFNKLARNQFSYAYPFFGGVYRLQPRQIATNGPVALRFMIYLEMIRKAYYGEQAMKSEAYINLCDNEIDLELKKTIFWVGCGISKPSGLPLGKPLTEEYLSVSIDTSYLLYVNRIWTRASKLFKRFYNLDVPIIRLESVIGVIDEVDKEFGGKRILQGFEHFHEVTPCENHILLNALAGQAGAIIITPNFDSGMSLNDGSRPSTPIDDVPAYQVGNSHIYHYHGTIFDINNLGATISNIKNGFPAEFERRLKNLLLDGYNIVCIGFSCSDYFDVTPFFDKLDRDLSEVQKRNLGQAIFFEYQNEKTDSLKKANRTFGAFPYKRYLYGDTTAFLRDLASGLKVNPVESGSKFDWQDGFRANMPEPCELKQKYYLIKMSNQLGLKLRNCMTKPLFKMTARQFLASTIEDAEKIGISRHMLSNFDRDPNKSAFTDALKYYRAFGFSNDELKAYSKAAEIFYMNRVDAERRNPFMTRQANKTIKEITDYMKGTDKNSWEEGFVIQSISYHIGEYFKDNTGAAKYTSEELYALLNYIKQLRNKHFSEFLYISYYTTLTKNKWRLEHLLEGKLPSTEELTEILAISLEISCISEAARSIKAYIYILLREAKRRNSILLLIKAIKPAYILLRLHGSISARRINTTKEDKGGYLQFWG